MTTLQLALPVSHTLSHRLELALRQLCLQEALEHARALADVDPTPAHLQLLTLLTHLTDTWGPRYPARPRHLARVYLQWQAATGLLPPDALTHPPLDVLTDAVLLRLAQATERQGPDALLGAHSPGQLYAQARRPADAVRALQQSLRHHAERADLRIDLAHQSGLLAPTAASTHAHYLAAFLSAPHQVQPGDITAPHVRALLQIIEALHLPGPCSPWVPAVGFWCQVFTWPMLAVNASVWNGQAPPSHLPGLPGAVLTYMVMQLPERREQVSRFQLNEARRQLKQLVPALAGPPPAPYPLPREDLPSEAPPTPQRSNP